MGDYGFGLRSSVHEELGRGGSTTQQLASADWQSWRQRGKERKVSDRVASELVAGTDVPG
jgi:hypothetical protein